MLPVPEFHAYLDRKISRDNTPGLDSGNVGIKQNRMARRDCNEQERHDRYGRFGNRQARLVAMQMDFGEEG